MWEMEKTKSDFNCLNYFNNNEFSQEKDIFAEKNKIPTFITNSKLLKNNNTAYNYEINEDGPDQEAIG